MDPMDVDDDDTYVAAGSRYSRGCWALARLAERELLACVFVVWRSRSCVLFIPVQVARARM